MAVYTLCDCIFKMYDHLAKIHISDVLWKFTQANAYKIALDESDRIMSIYEKHAEVNPAIAVWLIQMAREPKSFEPIKVEVDDIQTDDELFLRVCSSVKNTSKAIVFSHQRWNDYKYSEPQIIVYNEIPITIYDKDEAVAELNPPIEKTVINANGSIVAANGGSIDGSKIKK